MALVAAFLVVVVIALGVDSPLGVRAGIDGQALDAVLVPAFLALQLAYLPPRARLLVLLVVPVTAAGEVLLSVVLGLYVYRLDAIPVYVPFGHAVLVASTLLLTTSVFAIRHEDAIRAAVLGLYAPLGVASAIAGDTFSLALAVPLTLVLWRSRARLFYLLMSASVLYVECTGALLGTWRWVPGPLGILHTTNPPLAVFAIYLVGDVGLVRLARAVEARLVRPVHVDAGGPRRLSGPWRSGGTQISD